MAAMRIVNLVELGRATAILGDRRTIEFAAGRTHRLPDMRWLGTRVDRRWLLFPAAVAGFLLQHAVQGWCPPVSIFRRLGFRTQSEIDEERYALKALRGDFRHLPSGSRSVKQAVKRAVDAVEE
jgi:hypothetical protein